MPKKVELEMIVHALNFLKRLNRRRLNLRRVKELSKNDIKIKEIHYPPKCINSILILHFLPGWGDFFYFAGLVKRIVESGVVCRIGTTSDLVNRFKCLSSLCEVVDVSDRNACAYYSPDCVLDLDWIVSKGHNLDYIKNIKTWRVTCSSVLSELMIFDEYIDLSNVGHISKRYQKVLAYILKKDVDPVMPFVPIDGRDNAYANDFIEQYRLGEFVYFNVVGSERDREFSLNQAIEIASCVLSYGYSLVYFSPKFDLSKYVEVKNDGCLIGVPKADFFKISAIASKAKAIISPDTSIVHLASAFNIPTMAVFCENDYDYYGYSLLSETWGPLAQKSMTIDNSSKDKIFKKKIEISKLPFDFGEITKKFMEQLN